tara:strand:- start:572 stop:1693 length:1122 start_codon:yes stop_codon:yes gene_type:complete
MKIGLIGAGRLGICLALLIGEAGYKVIASDVREDYVYDLQNKKYNGSEPAVQELLSRSTNVEFTTDNSIVIKESDIIFTLVQTPSLEDGNYDVSSVWDVVDDIKETLDKDLVIGKSFVVGCTTNPGDCEEFQKRLEICGVDVFYNPEFIAQGSIVQDLKNADMVLLGGYGHHVPELERIYYGIQKPKKPYIHNMSTKAAELTKIAVNCFLTTKISYANQVGQVMIKDGLEDEVDIVLKAIGSDSRIGNKYLGYGFGFGGPCFPRDNRAFAAYAHGVGVYAAIGETTDNFNNEHTEFLRDYYSNKNKGELPFCFKYLTYKPGIDILTESRPYDLALALLEEGYKVYCLDDTMKDQCDDRIIFKSPTENVCWIDL